VFTFSTDEDGAASTWYRKKSESVTLNEVKGLSSYFKGEILRCAQNDKFGNY
jgi:hypothetical protein